MNTFLSGYFVHEETGVNCIYEIDFYGDSLLYFDIDWSSEEEYLKNKFVSQFQDAERWCRVNSGIYFDNEEDVRDYIYGRLHIKEFIR